MSNDRKRLVGLIVAVAGAACLIGRAAARPGCPGQGSCLAAHNNPGCENVDCCNLVCGADPFCCQTKWDQYCAQEGLEWCASSCGGPLAADCLFPAETPACIDPSCCDYVCSFDSYCCAQQWDEVCADEAYEACAASCGGSLAGDCLQAHADPACWDGDCCDLVCSLDSYCCEAQWDAACAGAAYDMCTACGGSAGSCYSAHGPNCSDENCCAAICAIDSYCCLVEWDTTCVDQATTICAPCGGSGSGSCFAPHGPGCDEGECCVTICALDLYCCATAWDSTCVATALDICATCGNPGMGSCLDVQPGPFCDDAACCSSVCALDDYCCTQLWDEVCVSEAAETCFGCGAPEAPSCLMSHASSGCDDLECCATVCGQDSYCCGIAWDATCVAQAGAACLFPNCYGMCPGDLNADAQVNAADLAKLLGAWGTSQCADVNSDMTVNANDLAILLGNWGTCLP